MKKIKLEKVARNKEEKRKVTICVSLIFLCAFISIAFMLFAIAKIYVIDVNTFFITFICVYFGIFVIVCPSALIFFKLMKKAKTNSLNTLDIEVQDVEIK